MNRDWCETAVAAGFISLLALGICFHLPVLNSTIGSNPLEPPHCKIHTAGEIKTPKRLQSAASPAFHSQSKNSQKVIIGSSGFLNPLKNKVCFLPT